MAPVPALPVVTLAVFAVLVQPITYCAWKHGRHGLLGWLVFQIFCVIRIVGSILQIQEAVSNSKNETAALILANVGLSPLLLGCLGVLHEARTARNPNLNTRLEWRKVFAYHGGVIGAMVLIIVGVVHEIYNKTTTSPVIVKVGVIGLLLCWAVFNIWTIFSLQQPPPDALVVPAWGEATILLYAVRACLPLLGARVLYSVLTAFIKEPSFKKSTVAKVLLSTVPEMMVILIMSVQGIRTRHIAPLRKMTNGKPSPTSNQMSGYELVNKIDTVVT